MVITIAGPIRSGKTVIAAVIKKALIDAGFADTDVVYGTTGIYANADNRRSNNEILKLVEKHILDEHGKVAIAANNYPYPRKVHILEDTSDMTIVMSAQELERKY